MRCSIVLFFYDVKVQLFQLYIAPIIYFNQLLLELNKTSNLA